MSAGINVILGLMIIASFLVATPLHAVGQALMASWLGDRSPIAEGRLTLNPRKHIDALGLILCIVLAFQSTIAIMGYTLAAGMGWASRSSLIPGNCALVPMPER